MGLLGGAFDAVKGAARIATAPLRTGMKMAGDGLNSTGKSLEKLGEGDLKGAGSALVDGAKEQADNVKNHFGEYGKGAKEIVGGHVEFIQGGVGLIGTPVKGAVRLAGNGLSSTGKTLENLGEGNLNGAAQAYGEGFTNQFSIAGDTLKEQFNNIV